eukprot:823967-Rhodomonas_salina.5
MGDLAVIGAQADPRCQLQLGEASSDASDAMSAHTLPNDDRYDAQRFWIEVGSTHQITIETMLDERGHSHPSSISWSVIVPELSTSTILNTAMMSAHAHTTQSAYAGLPTEQACRLSTCPNTTLNHIEVSSGQIVDKPGDCHGLCQSRTLHSKLVLRSVGGATTSGEEGPSCGGSLLPGHARPHVSTACRWTNAIIHAGTAHRTANAVRVFSPIACRMPVGGTLSCISVARTAQRKQSAGVT